MNLTSNFDYCVELGIASVREIFHLAFKAEDRYPHNVGPFTRDLAGRQVTIRVRVMDDATDAADLSFADRDHVRFSFPFEITAETPDAPDPALSRITMRARVEVPARLATWPEDGRDVLGLTFEGITAADVTVVGAIAGLPTIDVGNFAAAIHARYDGIPHRYEQGTNVLLLYDDTRDPGLDPANAATPFDIGVELVSPGGAEHLRVTAPIHVDVSLQPFLDARYASYGRLIFHRRVERTDSTISVTMGTEPADAALKTVVQLDTAHVARDQVQTQLQPRAVAAINAFGTITEPAFSEGAAAELLRAEVAAYLATVRYPVYSPDSGDPERPIGTPRGFCLVDAGVLAVLLNRRTGTADDDVVPDDFTAGGQLALAVGRAKVDEVIAEAIEAEFPDLDSGGHHVETEEGSATLKELNVVPANAGEHDESVGHLWVTGYAEVHIDCWPDPDASFEGPIYVDATRVDGAEGCTLDIDPRAGDFDIDQSCCDVFLDLIIPIVGWVMLAVVESTIDEVGGELIVEFTENQGDIIAPVPPVVNGIAEVSGCLTGLTVTSDGFILPGEITIRRLDESFEDRRGGRDLPRP